MPFSHFPPETIAFLEGLRANNSKSWFGGHRGEYDSYWLAPAKDLVAAVGERLAAFAPGVSAEPRVNGSIFRINRDTRFSKDKTPYKDHLDFWFWEGARKGAVSGFYLRVAIEGVIVGAGCHGLDRERLDRFRNMVAAPVSGTALGDIAASIKGAGYTIGGARYSRPPKGLDASGPAAQFLLHNALYADIDQPLEVALKPGAIVDAAVSHWQVLAPLHHWLIENVQAS